MFVRRSTGGKGMQHSYAVVVAAGDLEQTDLQPKHSMQVSTGCFI